MESTSKLPSVSDRDLFYYRQRSKNRVFEALTAFFAEEAERRGITKRDIAESLRRDPAQITRWLTVPSNMTVETISDLLLSLGAEMDHVVTRFNDRPAVNEIHPLIEKLFPSTPVAVPVPRTLVLSKRYHKVENALSSPITTVSATR